MSNSTKRSFCYEQPFSIGGHVKRTYMNMAGPTSYDNTNKDIISAIMFGGGPNAKFLNVQTHRTNSGTYSIFPIFSTEGPVPTVKLIWVVVATGAEVANAVDLSAERFRMLGDFIQ